jgi:hypothetical protein
MMLEGGMGDGEEREGAVIHHVGEFVGVGMNKKKSAVAVARKMVALAWFLMRRREITAE